MTDRLADAGPDKSPDPAIPDPATSPPASLPTTQDPFPPELQVRIGELERRLESAQSEIAAVRERSNRERLRFEVELDRHRRLLDNRSKRLEKVGQDLARLRANRAVRIALAVRKLIRRPLSYARRSWWAMQGIGVTLRERVRGGASGTRRRTQASPAEEQALLGALRSSIGVAPGPSDELVTIVVSVVHGGPLLLRCLASLTQTNWPRADVVLVGAAGIDEGDVAAVDRALAALAARSGWSAAREADDLPIGPGRQAAAAATEASFVAFVHDDVEPIDPGWLSRLVAAQRDRGAGAVGARLIHARRPAPGRRTKPGAADEPADLTLEHRGIDFAMAGGMPRPRLIGRGGDPLEPAAAERSTRPAVADSCLLIPRDVVEAFVAVPAADPTAATVEFCLRLWAAGRPVVYEGSAVLWHHAPQLERQRAIAAGAARTTDGIRSGAAAAITSATPVEDPWQDVLDRWGPRLFREVFRDRLGAERTWSGDPLHVAITLTRDDNTAPYGDWYTAHELGDALASLGWRISYIERHEDRWYQLGPSVDVVIALLDLFDLSRIPRGVVTIAWVRNWTDRWLSHPWFNDFDIVLASSARSKELIEAGSTKRAHLMPLATNPARFRPGVAHSAVASDAVFVGSHWGEQRGVASALPALAAAGRAVRVWGRNWDRDPGMADLSGGVLDYEDVPAAYASSKIAVDDTASPTKPYGAVNSRLFDALAAGTIVLTDNELGVRELFDEDFPTWETPEDLIDQVDRLLGDDERRAELAKRYRDIVLERHTYARRAEEFRSHLLDWLEARRFGLQIGPQTWKDAEHWGDLPFARDIARQLERRGHPSVVLVFQEQSDPVATRCDASIHIFGVRAPKSRPGQVNLLWVISHPDRVTSELCASYDVIFVASDVFLEHLKARTDVPLVPLHQATEPERFFPEPGGPEHELLFVGNSRGVRRPIIDDLASSPFDLSVYGGSWTPELIDPKHVKGEWIPNDELRRYYAGATIVLNDHWQDMRDEGFFSNRLYDALASGAFIVSDDVHGMDREFDDGVVTYRRRDDLIVELDRYLADPEARRAVAARGRAAVLARHTFGHRAETILDATTRLLAEQPAAISDGPMPARLA